MAAASSWIPIVVIESQSGSWISHWNSPCSAVAEFSIVVAESPIVVAESAIVVAVSSIVVAESPFGG